MSPSFLIVVGVPIMLLILYHLLSGPSVKYLLNVTADAVQIRFPFIMPSYTRDFCSARQI